MTADLTPAQVARLEAIEAAPWAEEAAVERVARALFDAANPISVTWPDYWARVGGGDHTRNRYRRLAVAAIDVMRGATDDGAVGRVLADRWEDQASDWYYENRHTHPNGIEYAGGFEDGWCHAAQLLRAAVGAPATAEGDDRG